MRSSDHHPAAYDRAQRGVVERRIIAASSLHSDAAMLDENVRLAVDAELQRERFRAGILPVTYSRQLIVIFARAFLVSADMILKLLDALTQGPLASDELKQVVADVALQFPTLREARDSSAHLDERVRGRARRKKLDAKPYVGPGISSAGGGILLENLEDRFFGSTLANGEHGGVEVSMASLTALHSAVQRAINRLAWQGLPRVGPP